MYNRHNSLSFDMFHKLNFLQSEMTKRKIVACVPCLNTHEWYNMNYFKLAFSQQLCEAMSVSQLKLNNSYIVI